MRTNNARASNGGPAEDRMRAVMEEMERYCAEHPRSPAALRRPQLSVRGRTFIALLGVTIEDGIAGFGDNVGAALRAFDAQYQRVLRPSLDCP